jgi:hypothetical protein
MASLDGEYRHKEYLLMTNSNRGPVKVQVPGGPLLSCSEGWDFITDLQKTTFKTTADLKVEHSLVKKEPLDMLPSTSTKAWKYTVFRQQPPKPEDPKRNRNLQ